MTGAPARPEWYRRVVAIELAVLVFFIGLDVLLGLTAAATAPQSVAARYIEAEGANNSAAMAALSVVQDAPGQSAPAIPVSNRFLEDDALQALLDRASNSPRHGLHTTSASVGSITATVTVGFSDSTGDHTSTVHLTRDPDETTDLLFPRWQVAIVPAALTVSTPVAGAPVAIDGIAVPADAERSTGFDVEVFPGVHTVTLPAGGPFAPTSQTVTVGAKGGGVDFSQVPLNSGALASARSVVDALFARCTASHLLAPKGCPQAVGSVPLDERPPVTWRLVGSPSAGMATVFNTAGLNRPAGEMQVAVAGHFQMRATFTSQGETAHRITGGTWTVTLTWNGASFTASSITTPGGVAHVLERPAIADAAVITAVRAGFHRCIAEPILDPPDCPNRVEDDGSAVHWSLNGNPVEPALTEVRFDDAADYFVVTGVYDAAVAYTDRNGRPVTSASSGYYLAYVAAAGSHAELIFIQPA